MPGKLRAIHLEQLRVIQEHLRFILGGGDGVVDILKAPHLREFAANKKNPIRPDAPNGNCFLYTFWGFLLVFLLRMALSYVFNGHRSLPVRFAVFFYAPCAAAPLRAAEYRRICSRLRIPGAHVAERADVNQPVFYSVSVQK